MALEATHSENMGNVRITKLEVKEIGPFGDLVLQFPDKPSNMEGKAEIHILTGENGTGKTTILELLIGALPSLVGNGLLNKLRSNRAKNGFKVTFIDNESRMWIASNDDNKLSPAGKIVQKYWKVYHSYQRLAFSTAFFSYSGYRRIAQVGIKGIQELTEHPFEETLNFQNSIKPGVLLQWIANTIAAEAIALSQQEPVEAERRRSAIFSLEKTIGEIIDKKVKFRLETKPYSVKIEVDEERLDFNLLPDGLKSIISWIADLLMRMDRVKWEHDTPVFERNFILFLDEIEVHMHPAWQRKILPAVQSLFPNAQIFISTHSPFVVGSVDGAWIHKLVKPNGDSQLAEGYPLLSEDAKSFRYWLSEVFDIASEYGMEADKQLHHFYELRNAVLKGANGTTQLALVQAGQGLAEQSHELRQIIEMELRQVNRRMALDLSL
jgi:predicted ATP-binding protein involved in virulence